MLDVGMHHGSQQHLLMQEILDAEKEERKRKREEERAAKKLKEELEKAPQDGAQPQEMGSSQAADAQIDADTEYVDPEACPQSCTSQMRKACGASETAGGAFLPSHLFALQVNPTQPSINSINIHLML